MLRPDGTEDGTPPIGVPAPAAPVAPAGGAAPIQIVAPPAETIRNEVTGPTKTITGPTPEASQRLDAAEAAATKIQPAQEWEQAAIAKKGEYEAQGAGLEALVNDNVRIKNELARIE